MLVSVRLGTDSKIPTLAHHTAKGTLLQKLLLRCTTVPRLSVYLHREK